LARVLDHLGVVQHLAPQWGDDLGEAKAKQS
jgi:hypothetical protein